MVIGEVTTLIEVKVKGISVVRSGESLGRGSRLKGSLGLVWSVVRSNGQREGCKWAEWFSF